MSSRQTPDFVVVYDLEATGGEPETDWVLEFGAVLANRQLVPVSEIEVAVRPDGPWEERLLEDSQEVVRNMHRSNGLWDDVLDHGVPVEEVDRMVCDWLDANGVSTAHVPFGGSGVLHYDDKFVRRYMPNLRRRFTYWGYDVGVPRRIIVNLADRLDLMEVDEVTGSTPRKAHRALDDARQHLEELRHVVGLVKSIPRRAEGLSDAEALEAINQCLSAVDRPPSFAEDLVQIVRATGRPQVEGASWPRP